MNGTLAEILETRQVRNERGETRPLHSAIQPGEGEFLQSVIRQVRPSVSLEVGCAYGVSSLYICEALKEVGARQHTIIDPYQIGSGHEGPDSGYEGIGLLNLKRAGLSDFVRFYGELSYRCLPRLENEGLKLDFAFIDGMHTFDYVLNDFFYVDKMLNVGGVVVFDDLTYPSIRKVLRFILTNLPYSPMGPAPADIGKRGRLKRALSPRGPLAQPWLKPELLETDFELGIPKGFVALRKDREDVMGDGSNGTRRWDFHREF
jgi:predicted O-methyltransferase YrrM